ncbi:MAG TPA: hypothetical protein VMW50_10050 [Dehalococcoidia bacterium]|jgi:hypothetical protein|nr:hypothetical protein [Dehalococcoidia bacterium]
MEEKDFKVYVRRMYDHNYSVRTNWEVIVLDDLDVDEEKADAEYGMWFDEVVEDMGEGKYV